MLHKIRNQPKKPAHHTGCGKPANSTNQKTIGINKLGTLLSSQTTGTTGTRNPAKPGLHRSEATLQAYPHQPLPANRLTSTVPAVSSWTPIRLVRGSTDPVSNRSCGRHPTENLDQRGYKL
jgi:hypothetical protein